MVEPELSGPPDSSVRASFEPIAGRYRVLSALGGGAMGSAYRAWDDHAGRLVVVKMPRSSTPGDQGFSERFQREVQTLASLSHPHVVPVLDYGEHEGTPYLVMPLFGGGSLASRQCPDPQGRRRPAAASSLHEWLPTIAAALDAAHQGSILHRDVKPANIFFDSHGQAFLGDFGIAKIQDDAARLNAEDGLTRTNVAIGTEFYMAPERFQPRPEVDGRCDQYSLAVCVYEMLAGRRPFQGDTAHIVVEHCTSVVPPFSEALASGLPASVWSALEKALAKNPESRFASCSEFARAVLADVPRPTGESRSLALVCPQCGIVIRISSEAAGRRGTCRHCRAAVLISEDGSALLAAGDMAIAHSECPEAEEREELPHLTLPARDGTQSVGKSRPSARGRGMGILMVLGVFGLLMISLGWLGVNGWFAGPRTQAVGLLGAGAGLGMPVDDNHGGGQELPSMPAGASLPREEHSAGDAMPLVVPGPSAKGYANGLPAASGSASGANEGDEDAMPDPPAPVAEGEGAGESPPGTNLIAEPEILPDSAGPAPAAAEAEDAPPIQSPSIDEMHWVLVDDPGNLPDANGLGAVGAAFFLGRYEVTNAEYCRFLHETAAGRSNLHGVGDLAKPLAEEASVGADGGLVRMGKPGEYRYDVSPIFANKPVTGLRWSDAARMANWFHNGGLAGADTEHGAYDLAGRDLAESEAVSRSAEARIWIPTRDEWYKAAYFKGKAVDAGYWQYPTRSDDTRPVPCSADKEGVGIPAKEFKVSTNFTKKSRWSDRAAIGDGGCVTSVGSNGGPGPYGTYDMGGNAAELVTIEGSESEPPLVGVCGGDAGSAAVSSLESNAQAAEPSRTRGGIRLARAATGDVIIHEPLDYSKPSGLTPQAKKCLHLIEKEMRSLLANAYQQNPSTVRSIQEVRDRLFSAEALPLRAEGFKILLAANAAAQERNAGLKTVDELANVGGRGPLASLIGPAAAADREQIFATYSSAMTALRPRAEALFVEITAILVKDAGR